MREELSIGTFLRKRDPYIEDVRLGLGKTRDSLPIKIALYKLTSTVKFL